MANSGAGGLGGVQQNQQQNQQPEVLLDFFYPNQ
jgi:hypothetical protein